jgi:hypothetical protein
MKNNYLDLTMNESLDAITNKPAEDVLKIEQVSDSCEENSISFEGRVPKSWTQAI